MRLASFSPAIILPIALLTACVQTVSAAQCDTCHSTQVTQWTGSRHASTQLDVAGELSASHPGENPTDVVQGEDCIACHAPTAVQMQGGNE